MNMSPEAVAAREAYFEAKRKKKRTTSAGVKDADIELALIRKDGDVTEAAKFLGMPTGTLRNRISASERLLTIRRDLINSFVDEAETELRKLVRAGNPAAVFFVLKTLGRDRGYTERTTVEHEVGPGLAKNAAGLIEAMRRGMQGPPPPKMITVENGHATERQLETRQDEERGLQGVESSTNR